MGPRGHGLRAKSTRNKRRRRRTHLGPSCGRRRVYDVGQRGDDGDDDIERGKTNLLHEGFPKLGTPLTVVLVCFTHVVGTYLLGEKLPTSTSTSNMILIDVAPSTFTNGPK